MKRRDFVLPMVTSAMLFFFYSFSATLGLEVQGFAILAAVLASFTAFTAIKSQEGKEPDVMSEHQAIQVRSTPVIGE